MPRSPGNCPGSEDREAVAAAGDVATVHASTRAETLLGPHAENGHCVDYPPGTGWLARLASVQPVPSPGAGEPCGGRGARRASPHSATTRLRPRGRPAPRSPAGRDTGGPGRVGRRPALDHGQPGGRSVRRHVDRRLPQPTSRPQWSDGSRRGLPRPGGRGIARLQCGLHASPEVLRAEVQEPERRNGGEARPSLMELGDPGSIGRGIATYPDQSAPGSVLA